MSKLGASTTPYVKAALPRHRLRGTWRAISPPRTTETAPRLRRGRSSSRRPCAPPFRAQKGWALLMVSGDAGPAAVRLASSRTRFVPGNSKSTSRQGKLSIEKRKTIRPAYSSARDDGEVETLPEPGFSFFS